MRGPGIVRLIACRGFEHRIESLFTCRKPVLLDLPVARQVDKTVGQRFRENLEGRLWMNTRANRGPKDIR
ncbi:MAG: hypothetical protein ABSG91_13535 [Syntrophobacteraceae bacterium]